MSESRLRESESRGKFSKRHLMWLRLTIWNNTLTARCFTISTKLVETVKAKTFLSFGKIKTKKYRRLLHQIVLKKPVRVTIRIQKSIITE